MAIHSKLTCPKCKGTAISRSEKLRLAIWGGKVECKLCGAKLVPRGYFPVDLILEIIAHFAVVLALVYAFFFRDWVIALLALFLNRVITGIPSYFSGFKEVDASKI